MTTNLDPRPTAPGRPAAQRPRLDALPMPSKSALSLDAGHRAMQRVLATPCAEHGAPSRVPCWTFPAGQGGTASGVCGMRVLVSRPTRRRREPEQTAPRTPADRGSSQRGKGRRRGERR